MPPINPPNYPGRPIGSIASLSKHLSIDETELRNLAQNPESHIYANKPEPKKSGGYRQTYRIGKRLRIIQDAIKRKIFWYVSWPDYLHGAIRDRRAPRDHISDAKAHAFGVHTVNLDVSTFFPSITSDNVYLMWISGFNFSPEVANVLTRLTTRNGWLYEGAPTSPLIANMIFGRHESDLAGKLNNNGIVYTRFIDDITVSFKKEPENYDLSMVIREIYGMLINKGLKPNRRKQKIFRGAGNGNVHSIITRRGRLHYTKKRRKEIKLEAYNLIKAASDTGRHTPAYKDSYESVLGKLTMMRRLHEKEAQKEIDKLLKHPPY